MDDEGSSMQALGTHALKPVVHWCELRPPAAMTTSQVTSARRNVCAWLPRIRTHKPLTHNTPQRNAWNAADTRDKRVWGLVWYTSYTPYMNRRDGAVVHAR